MKTEAEMISHSVVQEDYIIRGRTCQGQNEKNYQRPPESELCSHAPRPRRRHFCRYAANRAVARGRCARPPHALRAHAPRPKLHQLLGPLAPAFNAALLVVGGRSGLQNVQVFCIIPASADRGHRMRELLQNKHFV